MAEAPWARKNDPRSEFEGGGVLPGSTIFPKGPAALTNDDRLRMDSRTGQTVDPNAPYDPWHWLGFQAPEEPVAGPTEKKILDDADPY